MDYKKLNTTYTFTLCDGEKIKMTLNFYRLYKLKSENKKLYERYNASMMSLSKEKYDELELLSILYVAYICALEEGQVAISEEEFIIRCGSDRKAVMEAIKELTQPKKK